MKYITRKKSLLTNQDSIEPLYTLKNFPVYIGCTDKDFGEDLKEDMIFDICKETGFIQLRKLLPLEVIYSQYHSEAVGGVWKEHHQKFAEFIISHEPKSVLEVGGSNGNLAKIATITNQNLKWTIVEPTPKIESVDNLKVIKGYFDKNFSLNYPVDTIVNSHVLEHLYDPELMIQHINKMLSDNGKFIFSVPDMYKWLAKKFPNTLNFEHTVFLTEEIIDFLLKRNGFEIIEKKYFQEHSIFYSVQKGCIPPKLEPPHKYKDYKKMYLEFIKYYSDEVASLNKKIENFDGEIYLFGAHIFSQFLLYFELNEKCLAGILDNSQIKIGKRLYGFSLKVSNPKIIKEKGEVAVILRAGAYNEEIKRQLLGLNTKIKIF